MIRVTKFHPLGANKAFMKLFGDVTIRVCVAKNNQAKKQF